LIGTYRFKYHGILKNFDFNKINKDTFPLMIESNIFNVKELSDTYKNPNDYFGVELEDSNECENDFYLFNQKEYHLKIDVLEDMYDYCEIICEPNSELENKIQDLEFNLNMQVSIFSQIKFLKTQILNLNKSIIDSTYYLLYTDGVKTNGFKSWFNFFYSEQIDGEEFQYIFRYLKGENNFVPDFIKAIWEDYFCVKNLTDYCKKKILRLERISGINEADVIIENQISKNLNDLEKSETRTEFKDIRLDIFKDVNSRLLFVHIVNAWQGKKNTAFFSRLFKYLQEKKEIIIIDNDSEIFRNFIIDLEYLHTFSRIQKKTTEKESYVWSRTYDYFDDCLKSFYSEI
jgi:hypothetical protein